MQAAISIVDAGNRANTALILVDRADRDAISAEYYSAESDPSDRRTAFATASLSKWVTAHADMRLVEPGELDLDRPVESYLTRWHFRRGSFSSRGVTVQP